ncbi:TonB-dependent siderophore receptor [Steroidobacter sp.]|uniref:TonB-dependent siderophore receptor n=1 Tax=Steroidobacter sp. TaxID=1978227 RepID=UPI001A52A628|nr:TonB-dependent siderophore receptor [Steroidobacter sp.]MBL8269291.1 TonB-dependent siderophore receptor [Steroidobacter sp.]
MAHSVSNWPLQRAMRQAALGGMFALGWVGTSSAAVEPAVPEELEEVLVSGTKIDTPIVEAPQSISVLSREDLEVRGVQSMTEALRYVPGVVVDNYGYEGRGYEYVILRGFDALYTGNYRDGLNQATGLYFSSFVTEPYNIEQVEVIRGPSSALFGQSDAGGIVNRISKRPSATARSEVEVQVGNLDRRQLAADIGGSLNESGSLLYRLVGVGLDADTQQSYPNGDRPSRSERFIAPSLLWQVSDDTSITLLTDVRTGDTRGYAFFAEAADGSFSGILSGEPDHIRYEYVQSSVGYQLKHRFNDVWTLRQNFRAARVDMEVDELYGAGLDPDGHTLYRYAVATDERLDQLTVDTQLHAQFDSGTMSHNLLIGIDTGRMDADLKFYTGAAPSLDLWNPIYGQHIDKATALLFDATQENRQTGVYLQDQIKFGGNWMLALGSRYDWVKSSTVDRGATPSRTGLQDEALTNRVGLNYQFDNGLVPYVSYTQSFLPQGGRDVNGNPFSPSNGTQYEVGVKFQPASGRSLYTAALFDLTKDNILTPDLDNFGFYYTAGERRSRGLELEARTGLGDGWTLSTAYTYLDAEVTRSNDVDLGKRPMQLPKHTVSLWADYVFSGVLQGFGLSGGARYVGKRFDDRENRFESPSYTLVDAAIYYDTATWRFALNSANLFDKQYFASASRTGGYYPGVERTITASVKYRW